MSSTLSSSSSSSSADPTFELLSAIGRLSLGRAPANHIFHEGRWIAEDSPLAEQLRASDSAPVALGRAPANHIFHEGRWVAEDSPLGEQLRSPPLSLDASPAGVFATPERDSSSIPRPPPLRRADVGPGALYSHRGIFTGPRLSTDEDDLMDRLRHYRSELQLRQDGLYRGCETAEQIAAADEEHNELSRKISAIEQCMSVFGAIFRTR